jgi:hypothetical protein
MVLYPVTSRSAIAPRISCPNSCLVLGQFVNGFDMPTHYSTSNPEAKCCNMDNIQNECAGWSHTGAEPMSPGDHFPGLQCFDAVVSCMMKSLPLNRDRFLPSRPAWMNRRNGFNQIGAT